MSLTRNDSSYLITNEKEAEEAGEDAELIRNLTKKVDVKIVQFVKKRDVRGASQVDRKTGDLRRKTFPLERSYGRDESDAVDESPEVAKLLEENGRNVFEETCEFQENQGDRREVKTLTKLKSYSEKEEEEEVAKLLEENGRNVFEETCEFQEDRREVETLTKLKNYSEKEEEEEVAKLLEENGRNVFEETCEFQEDRREVETLRKLKNYSEEEVAKLLEENGRNVFEETCEFQENQGDQQEVKTLTKLKNYSDKEEEEEVAKLLEEDEQNVSEDACKFEENGEDQQEVKSSTELKNYCDKEEEKKQIGIFDLQSPDDGDELKYRILHFIDVFISLTIVGPMVIGFWRGIWNLMDVYLEGYSGWYSLIAGCLVHTIFTILRNSLHDSVASSSKMSRPWRLFWKITQILYTYVFGVACNTHWRGGWIVFDDYFGSNMWFVTAAMLSMLAALIFLRSLRNLLAPPIVICVDNFNYVFWFPTRYKLMLGLEIWSLPFHTPKEFR